MASDPKNKGTEKELIRQLRIPKLNASGDDFINMIDWNQTDLIEPPLTIQNSDEFIDVKKRVSIFFPSNRC